MSSPRHTPIELGQDCDVTLIPSGQKVTLQAGERVVVTQALGGTINVQTERGHLARISSEDASTAGRTTRALHHVAPSNSSKYSNS